jgi:hypothetical protein
MRLGSSVSVLTEVLSPDEKIQTLKIAQQMAVKRTSVPQKAPMKTKALVMR